MSHFDQTGLSFKLIGTDSLRDSSYAQPVVDSTIPKALSPVFGDILISLLKILRKEAFPSFPGSDVAKPSREVYVFSAKETQRAPAFKAPIRIEAELWETICAPVLDTLGSQQSSAFWFTLEGERNLEALLRKTLNDNHYTL